MADSTVATYPATHEGPPASGSLTRRWSHMLAWLLCAATLVLLTAGALVTGTGSGLAVPDWPLAYGQFFPPMVGGILYEHGHRLIAGTVGLLTLLLALWLWRVEPRRGVRWLAMGAVGLVFFQGLLGGITVLLLLPTAVSVSHALFAQLFFLMTMILTQVTAPGWDRPHGERSDRSRRLGRLGSITGLALLVQLVIGATVRHSGAGLAIPDFPLAYGRLIPSLSSFPVTIHFLHRVGALLVTILVAAIVWESVRGRVGRWLMAPVAGMAALVVVQILLGGAIIWSGRSLEFTTLHLINGALLLGMTGLLTLRTWALPPAAREGGAAT